jgi:type IV pilus assembly protein PilQ
VKQVHSNVLISSAAACVILAAQPVLAQTTEITEVKLAPSDGGISVILNTSSGNKPQIFTTKRDKALVADIINTKLRLPQGKSFREENPAPGIAFVEVNQLEANSVRVTVMGSENAPVGKPVVRENNNLTLGFTANAETTAATPTTQDFTASLPKTPDAAPAKPGQKLEVLVPNPQVSIDGKPAQPAGPNQPYNLAPPFLPRAVAPPVGDITVSNIDTSPSRIDLGTQERVPRLVLRDAPVREVLSLLARAAGLNLAYVGAEGAKPSGGQPGAAASNQISLDIENEPVQDVFNYVLRLSGLEANRSGRTIFVGTKLPNSTRDNVMRSLRLNQVTVGVALNFLVALGAESAVSRERLVTSVNAVPVGGGAEAAVTQTQTTTETKIETQRVDYKDSIPLLRGLQASGDERTNSVTLVGSPKVVDMAISQLTQLDVRRRQVVVNVKIIDVNLLGIQDYNSSFSFGIGNNYFSSDGGAATFNFGGSRPATSGEVANSITDTPVIENPITGEPFLSTTQSTPLGGTSGTTVINNSTLPYTVPETGQVVAPGQILTIPSGVTTVPTPISPATSNPLQPGFTDITQPLNAIRTISGTGNTQTVTTTQGVFGEATAALPSLYKFPRRFLASLQAQVQSGNAKILTDPTLIVQEGSEATVKLTSEVYGGIRVTDTLREPIIKEAGLTLRVRVDRIDDNGFVSLSVAPTVSAFSGTSPTPDGDIALLAARSLASGQLRLRDGQTLILSGIIQDQDRTTVSKLPILGDIPLLGSLFRRTNRTNERREVIVLLTPQVMDDSQRSGYGYNYTPSPQVRDVLERRGLKIPGGSR